MLMTHIAQEKSPAHSSAESNDLSEEVLAEPLTYREKEILKLLAEGLSNPKIGEKLNLAPGTVRNYVSDILAKLGVSDRTQAAVTALKLKIL